MLRYLFGVSDAADVDRLSTLLTAIRSLEETADRIESTGSMLHYPAQARAMAAEHRIEARALWRRGVRPHPGTVLPKRQTRAP